MIEDKIQVEALLEEGVNILEIMDRTGIKMKLIRGYQREWMTNKESQLVIDIVNEDEENLGTAIDTFKKDLESQDVDIDFDNLDKALDNMDGLKALNKEMQDTCSKALKRANQFLDDDNTKLTPAQWKTIVDGIAGMYSNIFVPQGTNINIMNNNGGGDTDNNGWKGSLR